MKTYCRIGGFIFLFLLLISNPISAQLCQGSLGDPIVNTTFGGGANPGAPLVAATTNYQYVSNDCPNDGFYTVRNNTNNCFGGSWHPISSDHTGNPNGYFMLVNASIQPSAFYLDTVRGLCTGTSFEFAAWVMNVALPSACNGNSIMPDLTFSIEKTDGNVLQSYNTNGISTTIAPTWKQFGFFFTTPAGVSDVVLRIVNNASGGCGNDLALDDISFRPCGPLIGVLVTGSSNNNISFCEGLVQDFHFTSSITGGTGITSYQWQQNINNTGWTDISGATADNYVVNFSATASPGSYIYRLSVAQPGNIGSLQCRAVSTLITVQINALPVTTVFNNGPVCVRRTIQLNASGGSSYNWSGPGGFSSGLQAPVIVNAQLTHGGKYFVQVMNVAGCIKIDSTTVIINPSPAALTGFSDSSICAGKTIQLFGIGGNSWQWTPATGLSSATIPNPLATPTDTTNYLFIAMNSFGCRDTAYTNVNVINKPLVHAGKDLAIIRGNMIRLQGSIEGNYAELYWAPPIFINDTRQLQAIVNPPADMDYILFGQSAGGCGLVSDTMHVFVYSKLYIPNAFTPNGDGHNDNWNIPALAAYSSFDLQVFDRYGELVFRAKDVNKPWDGRYKGEEVPAGAYIYLLDLKNGQDIIKGSVMIIK